MLRAIKRTVTIFVILSLIYANINIAISGVISYAIDNSEELEGMAEVTEEKAMSIQISDFNKNAMLEQETEYSEKLVLDMNFEEAFSEIMISDINSKIDDGIVQDIDEEFENQAKIFYKTTKINKKELIDAIGEDGILEIEYKELEPEAEETEIIEEENTINEVTEIIEEKNDINEERELSNEESIIEEIEEKANEEELKEISNGEENEIKVLPEENIEEVKETGIIIAENGIVKINSDIEADEEGNFTVIYPANTITVNLKITTNTNQIEKLTIVNNKIIEKVENIEKVNVLETSKNIVVTGKEEILNSNEIITTPIYYSKTVAELGIDKAQISTSVENKVNFTITMYTDKVIYDLYKNPQFIIELPKEIETIKIDNIRILNKNNFEIEAIEQGSLDNGNKGILIKLKGEQEEYTKSIVENIQVLLETTIETNKLIPTLNREINLHYYNENAKTYDGIGEQVNGINAVQMEIVSDEDIIVETKAIVGENTVEAFREDYKEIIVEPNTYETVQIIGTTINNTGADIINAKIL